MQFDEVDKATIEAFERHVRVIFSILSSRCVVTQAYQRPNWAPAHIYCGCPSWGPAQHHAKSKLTNHRTVYSHQSQDSLFWPITRQFILTNHGRHTNTADQMDMWNQLHSVSLVGGRLWLSEVQRQVKEQTAWFIDSTRTARLVAG